MVSERTISFHAPGFSGNVTVYTDPLIPAKACIIYFHGGGLLYGMRTDLPDLHKEMITKAGYAVIACDYPLAPAVSIAEIRLDVISTINEILTSPGLWIRDAAPDIPFFLWGRSSGAYLCLLAAASGRLQRRPAGILSFYGYGFLCDGWFLTPSRYYRNFPPAAAPDLSPDGGQILTEAPMETFYSRYVYARQQGNWFDLIYRGRQKFFYQDFTLRSCSSLPCPLFCAHSTGDPDVPYEEFLALCVRYKARRFVASAAVHDFDRNESSSVTTRLLEAMIRFCDQQQEQK